MDKQYLKQTKSSLAKLKEPANLRERIQTLSATVSELKQDMRQELTAAETLERVEKQSSLNSQVQALRKAFTELADALAEEVERLQEDTKSDLRRDIRNVLLRVEALTEQTETCSQTTAEVNVTLTTQMRQTNELLIDVQKQQDHLHQEVSEVKETLLKAQDDNKQVFEQMRSILHNNITHTAALQKNQKRVTEELKTVSTEASSSLRLLEDYQKSVFGLEDRLNSALRRAEDQLQDLSLQVKSLTTAASLQDRDKSNAAGQLSSKVQDISDVMQQRLQLLNTYIDDKHKGLEDQFEDLRQRLESYADKGSLSERVPTSGEDREVRQRLDYIETMMQTQRREIFASITTLEQATMKKHDSIVKAIYHMSRELNLQNPISVY